jgi:anti-sigma-K factor RskA
MEQSEVHALTAAYALDALDEAEEREYEEHLRNCERCREELAAFTDTASALAYAVDSPPPPPGLRDRILEAVQAERAVVVPFRPRRRVSWGLGAVAAAAAVVALGLGLWANSLSGRLDRAEEANAILGDPSARSSDLTGADGRVVVSRDGDAVLVVSGLDQAPSGKDYQAWVIEGDQSPRSAGVFEGGGDDDLVRLKERVPPGAVVAVTLERDGGVDAPTQTPLFSARA